MNKEIVTKETLVLRRYPPGDRWYDTKQSDIVEAGGEPDIYSNLTDALEHIFQKTGCVDFRIAAAEGKIYSLTRYEKEVEPPKGYSIYGDE